MLVKSNNKQKEEIDWLAIGQKQFRETNPFGYKDYKEEMDKTGWWKTIEYTDENGKKAKREINALGQILNYVFPDETKVSELKEPEKKKLSKREEELKKIEQDWLELEKELDEKYKKKEDFPEEYYNFNWNDTPEPEPDENNLSKKDFYNMDWRETQYQLYKLLLNISSFLYNTGSSEKK